MKAKDFDKKFDQAKKDIIDDLICPRRAALTRNRNG